MCVSDNIIQECGKEEICKDKIQVNVTQPGRKRLISSGSSDSTSAEQDTGKKCRDADQEETITSSKVIFFFFNVLFGGARLA